jgi:hypothetical protein
VRHEHRHRECKLRRELGLGIFVRVLGFVSMPLESPLAI